MPDIPASEPTVVPAKPEQVFDLWGVEEFKTEWPNLKGSLLCTAIFRSARRDKTGTLEAGPVGKSFTVPDLWERMGTNPKIGQAFALIVEALTEEAMKEGVI
jgi:hypothetical protein